MNISLNTGIKKIGIENENGEVVAVLKLDTKNTNILTRFSELVSNAKKINEKFKKRYDAEIENTGSELTAENISTLAGIYSDAMGEMIEETEAIFGENLIHDIFAENYELDPNFVPDISVLSDFYEQITPIMKEVYEKDNMPKYSPVKKGKKTRAQEIAEFVGK